MNLLLRNDAECLLTQGGFSDLDDVKGETVTIAVSAPAAKFDEFMPRVQKVLDSVQWKGT